ncbi:hypothetical protein LCGC14_2347850, partial [marine sediment metagenome]
MPSVFVLALVGIVGLATVLMMI